MIKRIVLSAGISLLVVTTIIAVFDYVRLLYRPGTEAEWQFHYALLVSTPVDAALLVYAQAVLDYFFSPVPAAATTFGTACLTMLHFLASNGRARQPRRALAGWRLRTIAFFSLQCSKAAIGKFAAKTIR